MSKKYDVIYSYDLADLIESVNNALVDGWDTTGNLLIDPKGRYLQPIKRQQDPRAIKGRTPGPVVSFG